MEQSDSSRPVLILGAVPRCAVPIARLLQQRCGVAVEVAGMLPNDSPLRSKAIRAFHRMPDSITQPDAFRDRLLALIDERGFDMIIPTQDSALEALCRDYAAYASRLHVACPAPEIVARVLDKDATLEVARQCGVAIPRTFVVSRPDDLHGIENDLSFPVVLKPVTRRGIVGFKKEFVSDLEGLRRWLSANRFGKMLLQTYCPGDGVGVELLIHDGDCVAAFQHRRYKEFPASGGAAVTAIAEAVDPFLQQASLALLRALNWEGVAMVEFRHDPKSGATALMEINGRYWGSCSLPFLAGVEFPVYEWQIAHGIAPQVPAQYAVGVRWRWTAGYLERCQRLLSDREVRPGKNSVWHEFAGIPSDLAGFRDSLWSWSDIRPGWDENRKSVLSLVKNGIKASLKKILPAKLGAEFHHYRRYKPAERAEYRRLRLQHALGLRNEKARRVPETARSFLFMCHGNIMRSPMSEALFYRATAGYPEGYFRIASAGLHAKPGNHAHPRAQYIAGEFGISLEKHRAQLVTTELIEQSDAIFAMDYENLVKLRTRFPQASDRILMLSAYGSPDLGLEIPDPFYGDEEETRRCYQSLATCIENLAHSLKSPKIEDENQAAPSLLAAKPAEAAATAAGERNA